MKPIGTIAISANDRKRVPGQATVEFAFMVPVLLAVLFGIAFFAMLFYSYLTLQLAVREGTNAIVQNPDIQTVTGITSLVRSKTFTMDPNQVQVYVDPPCDSSPTNPCTKDVRVSVKATYTVPLPQISIPIISGQVIRFAPIQIQAQSIMTVN